jgi:head-tail adaptor
MAKRNVASGRAIPMEPGERDRAVLIEQAVETTGSSGFPVQTWTTLAYPVWMRKMDMRMQERFNAAQISAAADIQWEMGYRPDMDPELVDVPKTRRLRWQNRTYDITGASLIGAREGVELLTLSKTGGA